MGFPFIEQMEQMIYYLNLKRKKVYIRNIIRELSKDVFHLFYYQKQELIKALYILSSISIKLRLPSLN